MFNLLLFLSFYLPFQLALNPAEGIDLASGRILIIILFLIWLMNGLKNKRIFLSKKLVASFLAAFLFINILSTVVAKNSEWSTRKLLFFFSVVPIYFVGQAIINTSEKKRKIIQWLVAGAFFSSLVGIFQFGAQFLFGLEKVYRFWANYITVPFLGKSFSEAVLANPSWLVNVAGKTYLRATAFFPDPHMFSFFLGLTIPLAVGLLVISTKNRLLKIFIIGILLFADALTFSRGGYLGIAVGVIFLLIIFWNKVGKKYKIFALGVILITSSLIFIPSVVNQRFISIFNFNEGSNKGRIETWKQALRVIEKNPYIGVGVGNYPLEIKATADYREPIYAHNTYLDIAAETGILNAFFWLGFLLLTINGLYRNRNRLLVFCSVSIVIFSVHSLVETGIYSATVLPVILLIASLNNDEKHLDQDEEKN